jgi:gamma-glutamyl hydrolase
MFRNIDNNLIDWVMNRKVLRFNHRWGVAPDKFRRLRRISRKLRITSTGLDREGKEFVNSFEGIKYPLYGVQYHPEKNKFNFKHREIDHSQNSIMFSKFLYLYYR